MQNKTEITLGNGSDLLFSYTTLVGVMTSTGKIYICEEKYSRTTTRHINQWLCGCQAEKIKQSELWQKALGVSSIEKVKEFHRKFRHPIAKDWNENISDNVVRLRKDLLKEELEELEHALAKRDPVEVLDALTDLQYVLDGTYLSTGLWPYKEAAFKEVHRSNMTKSLNYNEDGKTVKGPNYVPPNLKEVLKHRQ